MQNLFLAIQLIAAESLNPINLIFQAGWVVQGVMALLLIFSIGSWAIIYWKWMTLRAAMRETSKFADSFWAAGTIEGAQKASREHPGSPLARIFQSGLQEFNNIRSLKLDREQTMELIETNLDRALTKSSAAETQGLQKHLGFLANTASSAPFIGLFGTVWGIMTSFINIGQTGASNLAVVAPGIAEALIATAMGLFAAIPAVLGYNFFVNQVKSLSGSMRNFASDFLNAAKRSL